MDFLKFKLIIAFVLLVSWLVLPAIEAAAKLIIVEQNDSSVITNVQVDAVSGGETIVNGKKISGDSTASASVYTEINGQTVQDIDEQASGDEARIQVKSEVKAGGDEVKVKSTVNNQGKITEKEESPLPVEGKTVDKEATGVSPSDGQEKQTNVVPPSLIKLWQQLIKFWQNIFSIFK